MEFMLHIKLRRGAVFFLITPPSWQICELFGCRSFMEQENQQTWLSGQRAGTSLQSETVSPKFSVFIESSHKPHGRIRIHGIIESTERQTDWLFQSTIFSHLETQIKRRGPAIPSYFFLSRKDTLHFLTPWPNFLIFSNYFVCGSYVPYSLSWRRNPGWKLTRPSLFHVS